MKVKGIVSHISGRYPDLQFWPNVRTMFSVKLNNKTPQTKGLMAYLGHSLG